MKNGASGPGVAKSTFPAERRQHRLGLRTFPVAAAQGQLAKDLNEQLLIGLRRRVVAQGEGVVDQVLCLPSHPSIAFVRRLVAITADNGLGCYTRLTQGSDDFKVAHLTPKRKKAVLVNPG